MKKITIFIIISLLGLSACSTTRTVSKTTSQAPLKSPLLTTSTTVIDLKKLLSLDSITPKLAKHRTVFVGEIHTAYSDHLNQLAVIQNLHKIWKQKISIGLEMIQQPYQVHLDNYIAGEITEREMLIKTEWYERWAYDFRLYRPVFDYARKHQIPLVALNIPKELTRRITKVGIKGLNVTERKYLPAKIDRTNKAYRKRISNIFAQHRSTRSKGVEKFIDAQLAWDEGMAYAAAKYLKKQAQNHMVIIAGGGHVIGGEGIPSRLDRMVGSHSAIVLNNVNGVLKASQGDYLLTSQEQELPIIGRIGVGMDNTPEGVKVVSLSKHGAAKKAGIKKGDIILSLDKSRVSHTVDVRLFMEKTKPDNLIRIVLSRNNKKITKQLRLKGKLKNLFSMHQE